MRPPALLAGLALALACGARDAPPAGVPEGELWIPAAAVERRSVRIVEAQEQEIPQAIAAAGRIAFDDQRVGHVFSPLPGRVTRVVAALGQHVAKGAPLLALVSPEAGTAFSEVAKAEADLVRTTLELARQRRLVAAEAASRRDLEAAEDAQRRAEAELARARQRATLLRARGVDEVTQELVLRSPVAGEVMARAVAPGMEIQGTSSGTPLELVTVGDIGRVWVLADVAEADVGRVGAGARATVRVAAWPARSFPGTVDLVGATLEPTTRTARVRLSLANADRALKPEMLAQVEIGTTPRRGLAVPREAILRIEGDAFVYAAAGEAPDGRLRFARRRVQVDDAGPLATVASGLTPGERVLVEDGRTHDRAGGEARLSEQQLRAADIRVATAAEQEVTDEILVGARAAFDDLRVAHVVSPVTGRVARVVAKPGDRVAKGAPLLTLVSPEVGAAFADAVKARAGLVAARHERDRQQELVGAHAGAPRDLEAAESAYRKAEAEADRAQQKARLLDRSSFDAVTQEYTLRSPVAGEVVARAATPGLEVQGQWGGAGNALELFTVGALDPLWIVGDVFEMDLPHVGPGAEVVARAAAYPDRVFRGRIDWVSDVLDPVTRSARVRCAIDNPGHLLRPEMAPVLSVALPAHRHLAVPREAVLRLGEETVVFVAAGRSADGLATFRRRRVIVGEDRSSGTVSVLEGLVPGEAVVVRGAIFLVGLL